MSRPHPAVVAAAAAAVMILAAYVVVWADVSQAGIGTSDFTATYVGATLFREGHGAAMYDQSVEAPLHAALIAPLQRGNLPFVNPPPAAVLAVPFTLLPLATAYRLWQAFQVLLLTLAVVIAARAAPWPDRARGRAILVAVVLVALAGTGTLILGLLGQWDGLSALGLAAAYALWRRDRAFAGGATLAITAAMAKPHLAIGLAALLLGWRDRRVLAGAVAGLLGVAAVSLLVVGPDGVSGFVGAVRADAGRWPLASMRGFTGLTGSWLGNGAAAQILAAAGSLAALIACVVLGARVARDRTALEPCLAAATLLSLLASPRLLSHDLVLLAPVLVALIAWGDARDQPMAWPGPFTRAALLGWAALSIAIAFDAGSQQPAPPGRLVPWVLVILAVLLLVHLDRHPARLPASRRLPATIGTRT